MLVGHENGGLDPRLLDLGDLLRLGHVGRIVQLLHRAVGEMHAIDDRGRRGDQVDIELALEPLADDLEMQQPEKAAAEAEAERGGGLHLIGEARIVETELGDRLAQILELAGIDREQAAEHHRLRRLEAGEGGRRRALLLGDGVAHAGVRHLPDRGGEEADLARPEPVAHLLLGAEDADAIDLIRAAGQHQPDALALGAACRRRCAPARRRRDRRRTSCPPAAPLAAPWRRPWGPGGGARSPPAPPRCPCRSWRRSPAHHARRARSRPRSAGAPAPAPPPAGRSC